MSQKKSEQVEESKAELSKVEILTVGAKNLSNEVIFTKELYLNPLSPSAPTELQPPSVLLQQQEQPQLIILKNEAQIKEGEEGLELKEEGLQVQEEENLDEQQGQQQDPLKGEKIATSSCRSLGQKKGDLRVSRQCFNKLCSSQKIYKKIRSKVEQNKYRFFCKECYQSYNDNLYCQFCQQIYQPIQQIENDDKWTGCDQCQRWNHKECQKKFRRKGINNVQDPDALYYCLKCQPKIKPSTQKSKKQEKEQAEEKVASKQKIYIDRDQRRQIFYKKEERYPNLQYFLQNYGFRLWINESQIKQDIQYLRQTCLRKNQQDPGKNKFKKL